jgi:outer membrane protein
MNTRTTLALLLCMLAFAPFAQAQRFGFIDSEAILDKMPEYKEAQAELDKYAKSWEERLQRLRERVYAMRQEFQSEELLLTPEMKRMRLDSIQAAQQEMEGYQERVFGYEGELFRKRKDLVRPIQDKVYKAVEKVCRKKRLDFMFDRSADIVMLYAREVHNYTDYVLEELGLGDPVDTVNGKD